MDLVLLSFTDVDHPQAAGSMAERATAFQAVSAWSLAVALSEAFSISPNEVHESLTRLPENLLVLLESPEGWGALAS